MDGCLRAVGVCPRYRGTASAHPSPPARAMRGTIAPVPPCIASRPPPNLTANWRALRSLGPPRWSCPRARVAGEGRLLEAGGAGASGRGGGGAPPIRRWQSPLNGNHHSLRDGPERPSPVDRDGGAQRLLPGQSPLKGNHHSMAITSRSGWPARRRAAAAPRAGAPRRCRGVNRRRRRRAALCWRPQQTRQ